jgi:hypothetical protein
MYYCFSLHIWIRVGTELIPFKDLVQLKVDSHDPVDDIFEFFYGEAVTLGLSLNLARLMATLGSFSGIIGNMG